MRVLKLGSIGPAVQLLQLALTRAGFGELSLDGIFGTGTDKALRSFQRAQKLYADGIAGNATQRQLMLPPRCSFRNPNRYREAC